MSVNLFTIVQWLVLFLVLVAISPKHTMSDTLKIVSRGTEDTVIIDSVNIVMPGVDTVSACYQGKIEQTGSQNSIEINSRKSLVTGKAKSTVTIKQNGKNNKVKINSQ